MDKETHTATPEVKLLGQRLKLTGLTLLIVSSVTLTATQRQATAETAVATLIRWPYLQQVTSNSAFLIWTTDVKGSPALQYGTGGISRWAGIISRSVSTPDGSYYEHRAELAPLGANTWYYYQIFDQGINLTPTNRRWFRTAHANGVFTFVAFGDSGAGTPEQYQVRDQMVLHWFDIFLHTGDIAYDNGSYQQFEERHFAVYREILSQRPFFPTIGNHEYYTDTGLPYPYRDVFHLPAVSLDVHDSELYYSFDWGYAHFVSLDSEGPLHRISDQSNDDMADWLEADLAADDHTWKIAIIHRPPYSSSPTHPETDVREKLVPIFEAYGVDLVLSGHNHNYERSHPIRNGAITTLAEGGVVYVVTGGGGHPWLYPVPGDWFTAARAQVYHFTKVHVTSCALILTAIDKGGTVIDAAILDKCPFHFFMPLVAKN